MVKSAQKVLLGQQAVFSETDKLFCDVAAPFWWALKIMWQFWEREQQVMWSQIKQQHLGEKSQRHL